MEKEFIESLYNAFEEAITETIKEKKDANKTKEKRKDI